MSNSIETSFLYRNSPRFRSNSDDEVGAGGKLWGLVLFCGCAAACIALSLVLGSYDYSDPGFSRFNTKLQVSNLFGVQGAWTADLFYLLFGWGAWVFVIGLFYFLVRGLKRLRGKKVSVSPIPMGFRFLAFCVLVLSCCALFFLRFHTHSEGLPGTTGGALGSAIGSELLYWMSLEVATAFVLVLVLFCSSVFFGFSWLSVAEQIGRTFERLFRRVASIKQSKEDDAFAKASMEEREKSLQDRQGPSPELPALPAASAPELPALPAASAPIVQPPVEEIKTEEVLFADEKEDEVKGPDQFKPIDYERDPEELAPVSLRPTPENTVAPMEEEPFDIEDIRAEEESVKDLPIEDHVIEQPAQPIEEVPEEPKEFVLPPVSLLNDPPFEAVTVSREELNLTSQRIEHILQNYKINAKVLSALPGPIITRFKLQPAPGVRSRKFVEVAKDLARGLGQPNVRIVENMQEADCIGLEVPNSSQSVQTIYLKEIINSHPFQSSTSPLTLALGKGVAGDPVVIDLAKAPHLLVAGTTGSGKSVGINAMILSMLYKNPPDKLKLILVDPKEVEFSPYEDIPHLLTPVITDMAKAAHCLAWAVREMDRRYKLLKMAGQKNFDGYNQRIREAKEAGTPIMNPHAQPPIPLEEIPYIIIIIDELADLLMVYGKEVETQIMRLTQKARAAGMHMIIATQRPSADIVTPVIKANCPSRISFQVSNRYDSTTILNTPGAEELLGRGDMFYMKPSAQLQRIHGAFVPDEEIYRVTEFLKEQGKPEYVDGVTDAPEEEEEEVEETASARNDGNELYDKAVQLVTTENRPSISYLQRRLGIGYNRAANLIEKMEQEGVVSKPNSMGKRRVLVGSGPSMD